MIKNVKLMELNTKTVTAILDTQTLEMTFVTQTNTGTIVKRFPQEQMVGVRSYPSREQFSPLFWVFHVYIVWRCFHI